MMRKTTGNIIAISRRPPSSSSARLYASRTSPAWARNTSASGVPRSRAMMIPSMNRSTAGNRSADGGTVQRSAQRGTSTGLRERAVKLCDELASTQPGHSVDRANDALPGRDRQSQQLSDGRQLREDPAASLSYLPGKGEVTGDQASTGCDEHEHAEDARMALPAVGEEQHRDNYPAEHANGGPTTLLDPELLDKYPAPRIVKPPTCGDSSSECTFDRADAPSQCWSNEPLQSWKGRQRGRLGDQSRRAGRITQIRPDTIFESVPSQ